MVMPPMVSCPIGIDCSHGQDEDALLGGGVAAITPPPEAARKIELLLEWPHFDAVLASTFDQPQKPNRTLRQGGVAIPDARLPETSSPSREGTGATVAAPLAVREPVVPWSL